MAKQAVAPGVDSSQLTVQHWRERFIVAFGRFDSLREVGELLAEKSPTFQGIPGWDRLNNIKRGKAGLQVTALAVTLMDEIRPPQNSRIARQHIRRDS